MLSLVKVEIRKVWGTRFFIMALAILLCCNIVLLWFSVRNSSVAYSYRQLENELSGMTSSETKTFIDSELRRITALYHIERTLNANTYGENQAQLLDQYSQDFDDYYSLYKTNNYLKYSDSLSKEYAFFTKISNDFNQVTHYEDFLNELNSKAQELTSVSLFKNSSYNRENIALTARVFQGLHGIQTYYFPEEGLITALNSKITNIMLILITLIVSVILIRFERDSGLLNLIRSTNNGRLKTAIAKLFSLFFTLLIVVALFYLLNLWYCNVSFGLGPLDRAIQSLPSFMRCALKLSVIQYTFIFIFFKWLGISICGTWIMFCMLLAKHLLSGIILSLSLFAIHYIFYVTIPATSFLNIIKYSTLISLLLVNSFLDTYRNLYFSGSPIPLFDVTIISSIFYSFLFITIFLYTFSNKYLSTSDTNILYRKRSCHKRYTRIFSQECYKLLFLQGVFVILFSFLLLQIYTATSTPSTLNIDELYYQHYIRPIQGTIKETNIDWLKKQSEEFEPIYQLEHAFSSHKIDSNAYHAALLQFYSLNRKFSQFKRVVSEIKALSYYPNAQLVYNAGWLKFLDYSCIYTCDDILWSSFLCALCFSGFFSMEYQTGMIHLLCATPKGLRVTSTTKLSIVAIISILISFLVFCPRLWIIVRDYGLSAWTAPIYSLSEYRNAIEIPLFIAGFCEIFSRVIATICMSFVTCALSQKLKNAFRALFSSLLLFFVFPLLNKIGLSGAKWVSFYSLFNFSKSFTSFSFFLWNSLLLIICLSLIYCCHYYVVEHFPKSQ